MYQFRFIAFFSLLYFSALIQVQGQEGKKLFTALPSSFTGVQFNNMIYEDEKLFFYTYEYLYNGGGVAIGDINNDGLDDIYFSSTTGFNKLYLNLGNLQFKDITEISGTSRDLGIKTGVTMIDINNDGWLDIVVSKSGPFGPEYRKKMVYINNGNLTFTNRAKELGLDDASYTTQTYFLDYDKDGDMDALLINHPTSFTSTMVVDAQMINGKLTVIDDTTRTYVSHRLYENRNGHFYDVSKKAGISTFAFGLSAAITDFNNDGWPDIYIAHDFRKPDYLYINNHNGTFTEKMGDYFHHLSLSSMGMDINDLNNDGREDVFVVDMAAEDAVRQKKLFVQNMNYDKFQLMVKLGLFYQYPHNVFQLNMGNGSFSDISYYAGTAQTDWSWAPLIADYDNDGWKDIYITNGYKRDITDWDYREFFIDSIKYLQAKGQKITLASWFRKIPSNKISNYFYHNNQSLHLDNFSEKWCDAPPSFSNGAAYADLDNDGDLDMVVNNIDDEAFILRNNLNETSSASFIRFKFYKSGQSKQEVYGTIVRLYDESGNIQVQRYDPQRGYMSGNCHYLHFGLGYKQFVARAEIVFPSGKVMQLTNLPAGRIMTLYESDAKDTLTSPPATTTLFKDVTAAKKFSYSHVENEYIDFKREPLLPYKCSRKGPFYTKADVNGDGKEDIYVGGAAGNEGILLIQNTDGSYSKKIQPVFVKDKNMEDGGAVFFDADGDKDYDLYVVSGGAEFSAGDALYQDRLYINDGKGSFTRSLTALPKETNNGSFVISLDFDEDGDMDLFVGGAVKPGKFPKHDNNMLLQNNNGVFTDITTTAAPDLAQTGIVNYAVWSDVDGDKKNELIICGEWMPLTIFRMDNGRLMPKDVTVSVKQKDNNITTTLSKLTGWWNTIALADIDGDGDMDIVAGNRGQNSKIPASIKQPCVVYAKDFDNNGSYDAVLGYYVQDKCYPMYHRDQLIDQMPMMRKKFYRYYLYAGKTMDDVFTPEQRNGMDLYTASCFESGVFLNEGNNTFRFIPFPEMAQLSTINDILVTDVNNDGKKDIIAGGNCYDPDVSTGNYDAMAALVMLGDGTGNFKPELLSGLKTSGEVRKIIPLQDKSFILLKNNAPALQFTFNN